MNLTTSVAELPKVGPVYQKKLKKLGIETISDLIYHFPHRYEDFSNIIPINKLKNNEISCIRGKILEIKNIRTWKKKMILTEAIIKNGSGAIKVVWFNQPYLTTTLKPGDRVYLAGKITFGKWGLYLSNPTYEKFYKNKILTHTGGIIPIYPETEGLSSRWLRFIVKPLLTKIKNKIPDPLTNGIKQKHSLLSINQAIWQIHFPDSLALAKKAQKRFSFEEVFFISLFVIWEKLKISKEQAISIATNLNLIKEFINNLPFRLTSAQKKSAWQIVKDLKRPRPMNRLLEGDVGSGKTVVAVIAALNVIDNGFQVAFMAPTEILAKQHFQKITKLLKKFKLDIALLTGKESKIKSKKISQEKILEKLKNGDIDLLIGTHALIQEKVKFDKLALVILDEQHRFGVAQRANLCKNKKNKLIPHLLSMTATPIPRTLALTVYGDLDLSLINELPKGRREIITKIIPPEKRRRAYSFIRSQAKKGRQIFVICPRIESSRIQGEELSENKTNVSSWTEVKAVKEEYKKLSEVIFPDLKIGILHGKMKTEQKEKIMRNFVNKKIDVLVSTSVVEVGIDIPNATVIMIEGAERFGLAQLYQFRGRVGRSKYQSFCFLFTDSLTKKTQRRLKALISSKNSFELAEKDLKIRGPGDFFGQRQWGIPDLAMSALKDISLIEKTRTAAKEILIKDPELKRHPLLKKRVKNFRERIHLE